MRRRGRWWSTKRWLVVNGLLLKISQPTAWKGGVQLLKEEEGAKPVATCEEKKKAWAKHWQCGTGSAISREEAVVKRGAEEVGGGLTEAPRK